MGIYQFDASNAYTDDYSTRLTPVVSRDGDGNVIINDNGEPSVGIITMASSTRAQCFNSSTLTVHLRGGDVIWANLPDANGVYDGKIDEADRKLLGSGQPKWDLGWTNNITYKVDVDLQLLCKAR